MKLSAREDEIAAMVALGFSNSQIADKLGVEEKTIKFHLTNIYAKEGVMSRAQLIVKRLRHDEAVNEFSKLMVGLLK